MYNNYPTFLEAALQRAEMYGNTIEVTKDFRPEKFMQLAIQHEMQQRWQAMYPTHKTNGTGIYIHQTLVDKGTIIDTIEHLIVHDIIPAHGPKQHWETDKIFHARNNPAHLAAQHLGATLKNGVYSYHDITFCMDGHLLIWEVKNGTAGYKEVTHAHEVYDILLAEALR